MTKQLPVDVILQKMIKASEFYTNTCVFSDTNATNGDKDKRYAIVLKIISCNP